jgi:predicted Holliday junction resolvase-like endonuclease
MIQYFLIALLVMVVITAAAILIAVLQGKRAKKAEKENAALHEAFWDVQKRAERLQQAMNGNERVEEKADAERKDLNRTPDAGLADRANSLFLQNNGKSKPAGNTGPDKAAGTGSAGDGAGRL